MEDPLLSIVECRWHSQRNAAPALSDCWLTDPSVLLTVFSRSSSIKQMKSWSWRVSSSHICQPHRGSHIHGGVRTTRPQRWKEIQGTNTIKYFNYARTRRWKASGLASNLRSESPKGYGRREEIILQICPATICWILVWRGTNLAFSSLSVTTWVHQGWHACIYFVWSSVWYFGLGWEIGWKRNCNQ